MIEKTITMSMYEYKMISLENETFKQRFDELAQEKMVYLTLADRNTKGFLRSPRPHRMSGQIVEKDELLNRMQIHLNNVTKQSVELELEYKERIQELEKQLDQASIIQAPVKAVTKWWQKLLK